MTLYRLASKYDFLFPDVNGHVINCAHACHCSCHRTPGTMHTMACCTICPKCRGFVNDLKNHLKECHSDYKCSSR